jgi:putative ABC transport system ATP-binding protein
MINTHPNGKMPGDSMTPHHAKSVLLTCTDLKKDYSINGKNTTVLKGISFSVKKGEVVVITGKSGAGKSTLMGILGGLARPTSGSLAIENRETERLSSQELSLMRRGKIGIIFQNFNLIPSWTAFENVEAALMHQGLTKSSRREKVKKLLDDLGIADKGDFLPSELSAGQQQRVAVARALANEPVLLLADEPTGELDVETSRKIIHYLIAPVRKNGAALIVATHGVFPLGVADRILALKDGIIQTRRHRTKTSKAV